MDINISAKQMELTEALKTHIFERMNRIKKYSDHKLSAEVYLGVEKYRNKIHAIVKGKKFQINSETEDPDSMYKAIDLCVEKLVKQLRRGKHLTNEKRSSKDSIKQMDLSEPVAEEDLD